MIDVIISRTFFVISINKISRIQESIKFVKKSCIRDKWMELGGG